MPDKAFKALVVMMLKLLKSNRNKFVKIVLVFGLVPIIAIPILALIQGRGYSEIIILSLLGGYVGTLFGFSIVLLLHSDLGEYQKMFTLKQKPTYKEILIFASVLFGTWIISQVIFGNGFISYTLSLIIGMWIARIVIKQLRKRKKK